jgi:multiple sugar transport system ATP-binding protein
MAAITLQGLHKRYGNGEFAVRDVNLQIAEHEFVTLVGPSGCGKSTTLRMIAGLEDISSGSIAIGNRIVNRLPPRDRDVAMVFQNYALYQHMSVYDNLAFGLRNKRAPEVDIKQAIDRASGILGLEELLKRKPRQLSGGQQQRVALGRCLVRNPKVFLFDEPLSNLDAKLRTQMRLEIKRLRTRVPTTSVFVTHDQVEAMTLGDRVVVMKGGLVRQVGTPLEVYGRPTDKFVAGFIGAPSMNFFDATIVADRNQLFAATSLGRFAVPPALHNDLLRWKDRKVCLGMRPEHLSLCGFAGSAFQARVDVVEQLGSEIVVEALAGKEALTVSRIDPASGLVAGDPIGLAIAEEHLHFFDPDSEMAIGSASRAAPQARPRAAGPVGFELSAA